jgi:hypothetical protein
MKQLDKNTEKTILQDAIVESHFSYTWRQDGASLVRNKDHQFTSNNSKVLHVPVINYDINTEENKIKLTITYHMHAKKKLVDELVHMSSSEQVSLIEK